MENYNKVIEILKKYNQEHIIKLIDKSNPENKSKLINQVLNIDFEELKELYEKTFEELYIDLEELHPITGVKPEKLSKEELDSYQKVGEELIKKNKFAVATMARRSRYEASDTQGLKAHTKLTLTMVVSIYLK